MSFRVKLRFKEWRNGYRLIRIDPSPAPIRFAYRNPVEALMNPQTVTISTPVDPHVTSWN